ncbi:MAG: hypothetical protein ACRDZS_06480 [Acidimicrobiales bacterium]
MMEPLELRPGSRLRSIADATEVVVVRPPARPIDLRCGGHPMVPLDSAGPVDAVPAPDHAGGTLLGKRYVDAEQTLEVLCTKPGDGSLSVGDEPLQVKEAKPLPASD